MHPRLLAFLLFVAFHTSAWAEYRMFLLQVTSADGNSTHQIKSNLDPDQYRGYHPLKEGDKITYIDTWMCRGRTNEMPACPSPRDPANAAIENGGTPAVLETPASPPPTPIDNPASPAPVTTKSPP